MRPLLFLVPSLVLYATTMSFASALNDAAARGDVDAISAALRSGADIEQPVERTTPLYEAIDNGRIDAVRLLIAKGADVNRPGKFKRTPLQIATLKSNAEVVRLLLSKGAAPDSTVGGHTPLQVAAEVGCLECVKSLTQAGADVNLLTSSGDPAVHLARINGHDDIAQYLFDHGTRTPEVPSIAGVLPNAQPKAGERLFGQICHVCHLSLKSVNGSSAPPLWGVLGRRRGSVKDFDYSPAMRKAGGLWTYDTLNVFLYRPTQELPGTRMSFPGLQDNAQRADVIAYLRTLSDAPLPIPGQE